MTIEDITKSSMTNLLRKWRCNTITAYTPAGHRHQNSRQIASLELICVLWRRRLVSIGDSAVLSIHGYNVMTPCCLFSILSLLSQTTTSLNTDIQSPTALISRAWRERCSCWQKLHQFMMNEHGYCLHQFLPYSSVVEAVAPTSFVLIRFKPRFRTTEATYIITLIRKMFLICNWHASSGNKVLMSHQHQTTAPRSLSCNGHDVFDVLPPRCYDELKCVARRRTWMGSPHPRAQVKTRR